MKTPLIAIAALFFLSLTSSHTCSAGQNVITDDGREVLLNDNGSWKFLSTDRFANTDDGRRIRLKDDGSWHYVKGSSLTSGKNKHSANSGITLEKVVVEKYEKKALKNTRVKTRTVFYLQLQASSQAHTNIKESDIVLIEVKDNNGKSYPVISVKYDGGDTVIVRAEKSPSILDDAKSMQIILKTGILGLKSPLTLSQRIVDFDEVDVDGFE